MFYQVSMANTNNELIKKLRDVIEKGGNIDANTRDVLLFSAIVDIYEKIEQTQSDLQETAETARLEMLRVIEETRPAVQFYKVGVWMASAIGLAIIGFIGSLLTGKAEITFK